MPIYEYRCQSCGHELEKLQRLSDPALTDCPDCGKAQLKRLISAAGFRLKGAGWYETDFKQSNQRNLADSSAEKSDGGNSAGKAKESGGESSSAAATAPSAGGDGKSGGASGTTASKDPGTAKGSSQGKGSSKSDGGSSGKSATGTKPGAGSAAKTA